jgi:hypothetical protein
MATTSTAATLVKRGADSYGNRISKQVNFTLCSSCFWSASLLDARGLGMCPLCKSNKLDFMPITGTEMYTFDYDKKRGVIIDFIPMKVSV